ncbi:MAG: PEP-CTERM sorting domain-containing protein [Sedimentisphaerales bacterium]|nr:PEP-CTERM sorting domain-containing protein [Sedimentisphaerales bacterium]
MCKNCLVLPLVMGIFCGYAGGGIIYTYNGSADAPGSGSAFDALDGTWSHSNGSDEWDATAIGLGRPGGAMSLTVGADTFLRIQDTGDPRDYGMGDPGSNRKVYLAHDLTADGLSDTFLNEGITLAFRARLSTSPPLDDLHPDGGGGIVPFPASGDGYLIHDGGKGSIGLHQNAGGTISFSLVTEADGQGMLNSGGLIMNNMNGSAVTGDVDSGEAGALNFLPLDPTVWHDFIIDIIAGGTGTHIVGISVDGGPSVGFNLTAGSGNDYDGINYLAIGQGSTGQSGAIDIDYVSVIPEPATLALLTLGGLLLRRRRQAYICP